MTAEHLKISIPRLTGLLLGGLLLLTSCSTYRTYNTMHWAQEAYKQGVSQQEDEENRKAQEGRTSVTGQRQTNQQQPRQVVGSVFFEDAAKKCLFYLSQHPEGRKADDAQILMGKAFFHLRRYIQSERSLRSLLSTQEKSKYRDDAQYYLVLVNLKQGNIPVAEQEIERLLDNYPKSKYRPYSQYYLGEELYYQNETARALEVFQGVEQNYDDFKLRDQVLSYLAKINIETENYEEALRYYTMMADKGHSDDAKREGLNGMGRSLSALDRHEEARDIYQEALRKAKFPEEKAQALLGMNIETTYLESADKSLDGLKELIVDYPGNEFTASAWFELGLLYKQHRDLPGVDSIRVDSVSLAPFRMDSTKLAEIEPLSQDLLSLRLAEMSFDQVRSAYPQSQLIDLSLDEADESSRLYSIIEQMEASDSSSSRDALARLQFLMSEYQYSSGRTDLATMGYERLIFEYPNTIWTPKAAMNLAYLANETGNEKRYREALELVIEHFPDTRYADLARLDLDMPVPEREEGFYFDELAAYSPPKIERRGGEAGFGPGGAGAPGHETYLQMRRRLWWSREGGT